VTVSIAWPQRKGACYRTKADIASGLKGAKGISPNTLRGMFVAARPVFHRAKVGWSCSILLYSMP